MIPCDSELLKLAANAAFIGLGWFVVHKLSAARDRDKARRELVLQVADGLMAITEELLLNANRYHVEARDLSIERKIKTTLQDVAYQLNALSDASGRGTTTDECSAALGATRRAITRQHFEDEHTACLPSADPLYEGIAREVLNLRLELVKLKFRQFPDR